MFLLFFLGSSYVVMSVRATLESVTRLVREFPQVDISVILQW
jgi:hypothetical protein